MKLIKLKYDKVDASVRQSLVDRQDMHRNIQKFFNKSRKEANVLYRITSNGIYVSSSVEPVIFEGNGMHVVAVKELTIPETGDILRFNVFTRPYKKREGHRLPLIDKQARMEWLFRQAQKSGFEIINLKEYGHSTIKSPIKHLEIEGYYYSGALRVTDKEKITKAIENGIGAEKAYGLGMLLMI